MVEQSYGRPRRRPLRMTQSPKNTNPEASRQEDPAIPQEMNRAQEKVQPLPDATPKLPLVSPPLQDFERKPSVIGRPTAPAPPAEQPQMPYTHTTKPHEGRPPRRGGTSDSRERKPSRRAGEQQQRRQLPMRPLRIDVPAQPTGGLKLETVALPLLSVMAGTAFLYYSAPIVVPLVAAVALAYVLSPAVDLVKKARIPHAIAVLIVMAIGVMALAGAGYLIFQESLGLAAELPGYYEEVKGWLVKGLAAYASFQQTTGRLLPVLDESVLDRITLADFSGVGGYIFKGLGSVFSAVMGLMLIILLTLFLLLDNQSLRRRLTLVLGGNPQVSRKIIDDINQQIRGFMLVKFATTVGLAIVFTVGLLILDTDYAYVWGPLAAVLNLVPYIGAVIGMVPPMIVAAIQTGGITSPLSVFVFMEVVQLLESNVITPKIIGDKVNLSMLAVLLSTIYWGWLWGMVGILLAVPITAAVKVVCARIEPLKPIAVLLGGDADLTPAKAG